MKYLISYECRNNGDISVGQFEFESEEEPSISDEALREQALKESFKFHKSGMAGLSITSVSLCSQL